MTAARVAVMSGAKVTLSSLTTPGQSSMVFRDCCCELLKMCIAIVRTPSCILMKDPKRKLILVSFNNQSRLQLSWFMELGSKGIRYLSQRLPIYELVLLTEQHLLDFRSPGRNAAFKPARTHQRLHGMKGEPGTKRIPRHEPFLSGNCRSSCQTFT